MGSKLLGKINEMSIFRDVNLSNCMVIACQHILETNLSLFESLIKKGLKPENIFLLGKAYSTNKETLNKFKEKGIYVDDGSTYFDSYRSFDDQFDFIVQGFLNKIKKKVNFTNYQKIILIDDGGYLVYWANQILKNIPNIVGVEQTSSGYTKLKDGELKFSVVNVARSDTKLKQESPYIAEVVVKKLKSQLSKLNIKPKKILVVGAGPLGNEITNELRDSFEVSKYDIVKKLSDFDKSSLNSILGDFDLIIGATGQEIINLNSYKYLKKGVTLVSASSSDREFQSINLRKLIPKFKNCHKNVMVRDIILLNGGFPINFDGGKISVPLLKIQLTRGLILVAVYLSIINNYKKGMIELDKKLQKQIIKFFRS